MKMQIAARCARQICENNSDESLCPFNWVNDFHLRLYGGAQGHGVIHAYCKLCWKITEPEKIRHKSSCPCEVYPTDKKKIISRFNTWLIDKAECEEVIILS